MIYEFDNYDRIYKEIICNFREIDKSMIIPVTTVRIRRQFFITFFFLVYFSSIFFSSFAL